MYGALAAVRPFRTSRARSVPLLYCRARKRASAPSVATLVASSVWFFFKYLSI